MKSSLRENDGGFRCALIEPESSDAMRYGSWGNALGGLPGYCYGREVMRRS